MPDKPPAESFIGHPRTWLITGASRGIGLGFVRHLLAGGSKVVATARDPKTPALEALAAEFPERCLALRLDLLDAKTFDALANDLRAGGIVLDRLIHNAGVFAVGEEGIETLDGAKMRCVFEVNVIAPLLLTRILLPHLRQPGAVVAALTSGAAKAPAGRTGPGSQYSYGASKAALNRAFATLDADLFPRGILTAAIGPGFVRTDMTADSSQCPPLSVDESVPPMIAYLERLIPEQSGCVREWRELAEG